MRGAKRSPQGTPCHNKSLLPVLIGVLVIVMLFPAGFMIWMSVTGKRAPSPPMREELEEVEADDEE